jgi:hypothetical protein
MDPRYWDMYPTSRAAAERRKSNGRKVEYETIPMIDPYDIPY